MKLIILADTHIDKQIAIQLRSKGVDIVRLEELDDLENNAKDAEILTYAIQNDRAILSLDNDFETLHFNYIAQGKEHKGIFLGDKRLQGNVGIIVNFIAEYSELIESDSDIHNQLIYIK